ncbi:uncharacterized protein LOC114574204 [Exaiptasia diaphana]|uniref:WSC domain-containing protein n=1 Tax=Exaiptasia diaphana TaxID=2652724 RepID=A0A913X4W0_EXADI|nr:uncharacterized protein LOC114574204 [Exaiptasia diaphana]
MKPKFVLFLACYISFTEASGGEYTRLGCFKDTLFRAMSEKLGNVGSVDECAKLVQKKGYSTFGVQAGRECFSKADAANKYKVFGASAACRNGMGGTWANDVYQFKEGTYQRLGCWKDSLSTRALPKLFGRFSRDVAVRTCADYTRVEGWSVFGVQANAECWSGEKGESTYTQHGNGSGDCASDGTGESLRNEVYRLPAQKCYSCNGKDSCTKITCSSMEPYCYKLSADQEIGGAVSRVSLAGCASNCTSSGESDLCDGKKNCHASCCKYENCNDPKAPDDLPKCYSCRSTTSASDCESNQYVVPCGKVDGAQSYCFTAQNNGTYWKGCAKDYIKCAIEADLLCKGKTDCSQKCCTGYKCNGAIQVGVSVFLIMACALMMLML